MIVRNAVKKIFSTQNFPILERREENQSEASPACDKVKKRNYILSPSNVLEKTSSQVGK
jgi:hypothetical protein